MTTISTLDHFAEVKAPYWAKFQVRIHAEDGQHVKFYQGFGGAEREFMSQLGHPPANYMRDRLGDQRWAEINRDTAWTLENHVVQYGYFNVVDDWGRKIVIERVERL